MPYGTNVTVECPRCGTTFDPSLSGGWCTDPECGSWRDDGVAGPDSGRVMTDGGTDADGDDEADSSGADGGEETDSSGADGGEETDSSGADGGEETESDSESDDANEGADESVDEGETTGDGAGEAETVKVRPDDDSTAETMACPACETEIAVADNFCRSCGMDVSGFDGSGRLTACPDCGSDVDTADSYCRECGEHLDAHRPGTDATPAAASGGQAGSAGRAAVSNGSPGGASGQRGEHASVPDQQAGAPNGTPGAATAETVKLGGDSGASTAAGGEGAVPTGAAQAGVVGDTPAEGGAETDSDTATDGPRLSLVARNREVEVGDGDTVGKEIRSIIMDTGGDEEDAVRVHREHVRFEREGEQFYLVALGKNPTAVNGEELEQGDRVPVEPGDRIDLSGVARIGVRQA